MCLQNWNVIPGIQTLRYYNLCIRSIDLSNEQTLVDESFVRQILGSRTFWKACFRFKNSWKIPSTQEFVFFFMSFISLLSRRQTLEKFAEM